MSEVVERIARIVDPAAFCLVNKAWPVWTKIKQAHARGIAREILDTIRDPSPDMLKAGAAGRDPLSRWQAMIDEAQK